MDVFVKKFLTSNAVPTPRGEQFCCVKEKHVRAVRAGGGTFPDDRIDLVIGAELKRIAIAREAESHGRFIGLAQAEVAAAQSIREFRELRVQGPGALVGS